MSLGRSLSLRLNTFITSNAFPLVLLHGCHSYIYIYIYIRGIVRVQWIN